MLTGDPAGTGLAASTGTGAAHAKAILFGEHAVVYGAPALAVPVRELGAEARIEPAERGIRIDSELFSGDAADAPARIGPVVTAVRAALARTGVSVEGAQVCVRSAIPHERGLGSSAAVAAAIARAAFHLSGRRLDAGGCYDIVQEAERVAHGNPSGLDARAVMSESPIRFHRGSVSRLRVGSPMAFVLADSGVSGSTAEAVAAVGARLADEPASTEAVLARLAELAGGAIGDLTAADLGALGRRMSEAHQLLRLLGVSTEALDVLVTAARDAGSPGAKLTGGGLGGCVIALADSVDHAERLRAELQAAGADRTWTATVPAS